MNVINCRRSVRRYLQIPVEDMKIEKLLRAAMQAPSAGNQRPWEFVVVRKKEQREKLSKLSPYAHYIADAPLTIVMLARKKGLKYPEHWQQDMGAATENLLLAAVDLGLGALWIGVAPFDDREAHVAKVLDLDASIRPFCAISIGYPDGCQNIYVDRYEPDRIYYETYSK